MTDKRTLVISWLPDLINEQHFFFFLPARYRKIRQRPQCGGYRMKNKIRKKVEKQINFVD